MDVSVDLEGYNGCQDIPMDHNAGEADDEGEDEDIPASRGEVDAPRNIKHQSAIANYFQPRPSGVENLPKGRFWLDTVQSK